MCWHWQISSPGVAFGNYGLGRSICTTSLRPAANLASMVARAITGPGSVSPCPLDQRDTRIAAKPLQDVAHAVWPCPSGYLSQFPSKNVNQDSRLLPFGGFSGEPVDDP